MINKLSKKYIKMDTIHILLVEDNPADQNLTMRAFQKANFEADIQIAEDGEEALHYLEGTGKYSNMPNQPVPDVILLDINMPKMNGIEFLKAIKKREQFTSIPVIILTVSDHEMDVIESYELGVNAYIRKPVEANNFIKAITNLKSFVLELTVRNSPSVK
jgi:CheY-like chemotaxis protein